jgi:hypothetical protein
VCVCVLVGVRWVRGHAWGKPLSGFSGGEKQPEAECSEQKPCCRAHPSASIAAAAAACVCVSVCVSVCVCVYVCVCLCVCV